MALWVFSVTTPPSTEMMVVGLVMLPNLRVGKPTPVNDKTRKKREELWFIFWKKYVALNHVWIFYGDIIIITWAVRKKNGGVGLWLSSKWQALICTCLQSKLCDTKQEQWPGSLYWQHRSCALYLTFWKTNTLRSVVLLSSTGFAVGGKKKKMQKIRFPQFSVTVWFSLWACERDPMPVGLKTQTTYSLCVHNNKNVAFFGVVEEGLMFFYLYLSDF